MALPFLQEDKQRFLDSESTWTNGIGKGWKGKKFLGMGCFGVTGLWEYEGIAGEPRPALDKVVVKMAQMFPDAMAPDRSALDEGEIGRVVSGYNSKHLIRQFGGNRVGDKFSEMGDVVRTFLEYCPGGTLHELLPQPNNLYPKPIHELDLWQIFTCLAEGVFAMDRGTSDLTAPRVIGRNRELMHCDLKADNVFFGTRDTEHPRLPICKIADFGEATFVDSHELQTTAFGGSYLDKGAPTYKPPEEALNKPYGGWKEKDSKIAFKNPRKGTCSNIWQVGALMNALIIRASIDFNPNDVKGAKPPLVNISKLTSPIKLRQNLLQLHLNHSQKLEDKAITDLYSSTLLTLVQECLFREPEYRPDCLELVKRTTANLEATRDKFKGVDKAPPVPDPWNKMPTAGGGDPPEPPTAWNIAHIQLMNGTYVDASSLPPPTLLESAIDILPLPSFVSSRLRTRSSPKSGTTTPTTPPSGLISRFAVGLAGYAADVVKSTVSGDTNKRKRKSKSGAKGSAKKSKGPKSKDEKGKKSESEDDWSSDMDTATEDEDDEFVIV